MVNSRRCARCGASSFRADRSLAGRLVCSRCGAPASTRGIGWKPSSSGRSSGRWFWWLLLLIAVVLLVLWLQAS